MLLTKCRFDLDNGATEYIVNWERSGNQWAITIAYKDKNLFNQSYSAEWREKNEKIMYSAFIMQPSYSASIDVIGELLKPPEKI